MLLKRSFYPLRPDHFTSRAYSLTGADAALFDISSAGAVTFKASPNFEAPLDAGPNNVYDIVVHVNDGVNPEDTKAVAITVTDLNDVAPSITTDAKQSVAENTTLVVALTSTDVDTVGTNPATFSIT